MQVKIHTQQNLILLEHSHPTVRQEQLNYVTIESSTRIGFSRFRIVDIAIGQVWIGDYTIEENCTLQVSSSMTGLLVTILCSPGLDTNSTAKVSDFPVRSLSLLAQTNNFLRYPVDKGNGRLLLFSYHNDELFRTCPNLLHQPMRLISPERAGQVCEILNLVNAVLNYPLVNGYLRNYLRIKSEELFILLMNEADKKSNTVQLSPAVIQKMQQLEKMIRDNLEINYTIVQLAKLTHLSISNLKKYSKVYFSRSLHQYLLSMKMEEAAKQITDMNASLKEIAFNLGFKSEPNFSTAFKKYFGHPPGYFRKKE